ncbi:MAG: hypothetical protein IJQ67_05780 [Bacilli bacterium]|nr:hypothetical protein [Bacilli bacterium]
MVTLFKLSESDKRFIIAILLLVVLVFVLIGFIGSIVVRVMKWQGKKIDTLCRDAVVARVVKNPKHFKRYAMKKNNATFFKESRVPLIILLVSGLTYLLSCIFLKMWPYNIFDYKDTGFTTLFYIWDFSDCYQEFFGVKLLSKWPTNAINTPHFSVNAIGSYIFVVTFLVGTIWYLIVVQRFIARLIRIIKLADSIYSKSLENYNMADAELEERKRSIGE